VGKNLIYILLALRGKLFFKNLNTEDFGGKLFFFSLIMCKLK